MSKDQEGGKTRLEKRRGEGHWGDEHYWDRERTKERNVLRPRRAGGYMKWCDN